MDSGSRPPTNLFDVYLRLRPSHSSTASDRFLDVENPDADGWPKYITIKPPVNDHRKRAVEKFAFTRVFEEAASQLDLFEQTGVRTLLRGVLSADGRPRDGLLATLGVTGSGKSHTILGSRSQRGLTQLTLDVMYQSIASSIVHPTCAHSVFPSLASSDVSEAQMMSAASFFDTMYGESATARGSCSRAQTPMPVGMNESSCAVQTSVAASVKPIAYPDLTGVANSSVPYSLSIMLPNIASVKKSMIDRFKDTSYLTAPMPSAKMRMPNLANLPQSPSVDGLSIDVDPTTEYALVISMYQVYNDRIFDLLVGPTSGAKSSTAKPRSLLFKSTERSRELKVVAGLRKVVCCTLEDALLVLETGRLARAVAGTGSNATSSRSHCFFCVEVKRRNRVEQGRWESTTLTIVDLAGSERARQAKTAGATLAEAGKINESLMYLGQCMQMQNTSHESQKNLVPFRQCKLTELLFSNSFTQQAHSAWAGSSPRNPQKALMIVTADATGDFNATSQILRYSALAREITVPRIPSVTSQILATNAIRPGSRDGATTPSSSSATSAALSAYQDELQQQEHEISRLTDEVALLSLQLGEAQTARHTAESCWQTARAQLLAAEQQLQRVEHEVRDECWRDMTAALARERLLWQAALEAQVACHEERVDAKVDILSRSPGGDAGGHVLVFEDRDAAAPAAGGAALVSGVAVDATELNATRRENEELRFENERLLARLELLEREKMMLRTPSANMKKQRVLKAAKWTVQDENIETP